MSDILGYAAADATAAITAAALVAPFVAAVDKAIAESASGATKVWTSVGLSVRAMMSSPLTYLKQPAFRYLWVMYGGTYCAANAFTSYEDITKSSQPLTKTSSIFCVNASLSLWKDSNFAKLFGEGPPKSIPPPAYVSWWARDFISMAVIFTLPPIAAKQLHERTGMDQQKAATICQLGLPLMLQPFVAPLHLFGYVAYNDPSATVAQQKVVMRREIWGAIQMRLVRCVPPYCAGTVVNSAIRRALKPSSN